MLLVEYALDDGPWQTLGTVAARVRCSCPDCDCKFNVKYTGDICKWCERGEHRE